MDNNTKAELENKIYNYALSIFDEVKEVVELELDKNQNESRIIISFKYDGAFNELLYDVYLKRFTEIRYRLGIGKSNFTDNNYRFAMMFKEVEVKSIKIPKK